MLFLDPWMLLGLLAVSVPVILHLLNRRRSRDIKWGAMIFLRSTMASRRRSLLLEDVLLLVCRCLAIAFGALALARPFLPSGSGIAWAAALPVAIVALALLASAAALSSNPGLRRRVVACGLALAAAAGAMVAAERWIDLRRLGGADDRDIAIVIDGSSSMTMEFDGKSNFQRAIDDAHALVQGAPRGTAFSLIVAGSVSSTDVPVPTTDRRRILRALNEARPALGMLRPLDALAVAAASLAQGSNGQKQIVMIGDGQAVGWDTDSPEAWKSLEDAFGRLPSRPQVLWRRLAMPDSIRNACVSAITLSRDIIGTDRPVRIGVDIANHGTESITPRLVTLSVEGRDYTDKSMGQIAPGATRTVTFTHTFGKPGAALVTARIDAADELPGDDSLSRVVHVLDRLRVLVLDGESNVAVLERPGSFVALALRPDAGTLDDAAGDAQDGSAAGNAANADGSADQRLLVDPQVVPALEADSLGSLDDYAAIVMADVPRLSPRAAETVASYVARGGGLIVLNGRRADKDFYNGWSISSGRVLPLELVGQFPLSDDSTNNVVSAQGGKGADVQRTLDIAHATHPALLALGQATDIDGVPLERWWRLGEADALATIGARLSDGAPFLAEKRLGNGIVLQLPISFEPGDSVMVTRRAFVPLAHELVHHAARPMSIDLNIAPSRNPTIPLSGSFGGASFHGLFARIYDSHRATEPFVRRIDRTIDFNWGGGPPAPGVPYDYFKIVWTGILRAPATRRYSFFAQADDSINVWLGDSRLIERGGQKDIDLEAGRDYKIKVEYFEFAGGASVSLRWGGNGIPVQTIPATAFTPAMDDLAECPVEIRDPHGRPLKGRLVFTSDGASLKVQGVLRPGVHTVKLQADAALPSAEMGDGSFPLNVAPDPRESRIEPLTQTEVDFIGAHVDFRAAASVDDLLSALRGASFGREMWRPLAALLLLFLVAEPFIARWISIRRRSGEEIGVEF